MMIASWTVLCRMLTSAAMPGDRSTRSSAPFRGQVRFIGAGTIGVAAIWSLLKILGPIIGGIRSAMAASRARQAARRSTLTERDLPIGIVAGVTLLTLVPIAWLLWTSRGRTGARLSLAVIGGTLVYHARRRRADRGGLRLYGRPDRRVELAGLGRRHPRGARRVAAAGGDLRPRGRSDAHQRADRLCRCSPPRSSSRSRRSRTTISRTSRPASSSARRRGSSRSRW
jgi:hypothetical protein